MLGSGWPVIHLPQFSPLELFQRDEIVLALLMRKLCEADRAQQGTFLAGRTQADDLDLFVFMLLVHACQL